MDSQHFDNLTRAMAVGATRRTLFKALAAGLAGALGGALPGARGLAAPGGGGKGGKAQGRCPDGFVNCRGDCVILAEDPHNCGGCSVVCPPSRFCRGGQCLADCASIGQRDCGGGVCVPATGCCPGEERACYTGPAGTEGVGICQGGVETCQEGGAFGPCKGEVLPQPETCNGLDDDCDGVADDGDLCGPDHVCQGGSCAGCASGETACSGVCVDLQSDEQHCGACDDPCGEGQNCAGGACSCAGEGSSCDTGELGVCAAGVIQCFGDTAVCMRSTPPSLEVCNGLDDDCDGLADEDVFCPGSATGEFCQADNLGQVRCCFHAGLPAPLRDGIFPECDRCCSGDCDIFGLCE